MPPPLPPPLPRRRRLALLLQAFDSLEPDRAIVPRLRMSSSFPMPMPVSAIVSVFASGSASITISSGTSGAPIGSPTTWRCRSFSSASEALESSSRRKTSRSVYSALLTMSSNDSVSAWKVCGSAAAGAASVESRRRSCANAPHGGRVGARRPRVGRPPGRRFDAALDAAYLQSPRRA